MALSTLGGIKTAIDDFLSRQGDFTAAYKAEYFIPLAHARIHYGSDDPRFPSDPIRVRGMEASLVIPTSSYQVTLPTNYLAMRAVTLATDPAVPLLFRPAMDFWGVLGRDSPSQPRYYTMEGETLLLKPAPDAEYNLVLFYWRSLDLPVADADTNWIMVNVPGLYLYGALLEAACVIQDDEQIARYGPMYAGAAGGLIKASKRDRYGGAPLTMRSDSATP